MFHEIPHSCFEYGTEVSGGKKDLVHPIYGRVVHGSPKPSCILHMLIRTSFLLYLMGKYTSSYVDFMVVIPLLFMLNICWLGGYFVTALMYGYHHVLISRRINNGYMT